MHLPGNSGLRENGEKGSAMPSMWDAWDRLMIDGNHPGPIRAASGIIIRILIHPSIILVRVYSKCCRVDKLYSDWDRMLCDFTCTSLPIIIPVQWPYLFSHGLPRSIVTHVNLRLMRPKGQGQLAWYPSSISSDQNKAVLAWNTSRTWQFVKVPILFIVCTIFEIRWIEPALVNHDRSTLSVPWQRFRW